MVWGYPNVKKQINKYCNSPVFLVKICRTWGSKHGVTISQREFSKSKEIGNPGFKTWGHYVTKGVQ